MASHSREIPATSRRRHPGASTDSPPTTGSTDLAASLTGERLVVLPFYHELRNALVRPERVKLQTEYFWQRWVPLLGPVRTLIVMRMRQFGYYNRQTGELRDEVARTYDEIAQSIGISTRSLERYFESEPDPGGGHFRVLKDPLLARFIRLRHQYVWRPGKSAPERTTNEYKIAMDEPLTPDDEAALRLAAARRLRHGGRRARGSAPSSRPSLHRSEVLIPANLSGMRTRRRRSTALRQPPPSITAILSVMLGRLSANLSPLLAPTHLAAQPVVPLDTKQRRLGIRHSQLVNGSAGETTGLEDVIANFAAANSREASPLERQLLAALVEEVDSWARQAGGTGAEWVAGAVVEAVESGSRYVAPRRIREICRRWAREGKPSSGGESVRPGGRGGQASAPRASRPPGASTLDGDSRPLDSSSTGDGGLARRSPPLGVPGRRLHAPATRRWSLGREGHASNTRTRTSRALEEWPALAEGDSPAEPLPAPTFLVDEALGLNNRQLWAAVLDDLRRGVPAGAFATWLRPTRLLDVAAGGALVVGVPNSFAGEWLGERLAAQVEAAVEVVLGQRRAVRFVVEREWLSRVADS